jgi:ParB-like chromosome segregation protein Spo0J
LLVVGHHRLEAIRKLHREGHWSSGSIRAEIVDEMDDDAALLAEIDENLIRAELSPAETAIHITRRKELYEKLQPGNEGRRCWRQSKRTQASEQISK